MPKRFFRTIRFRLTLWNTVVLLVACLLALLTLREAMRLTIENEARNLLYEEALELELAVQQLYPDQASINDEFERKVLGHSQHDWFAALLDGDQHAIWKSRNYPADQIEFVAAKNSNQNFAVGRSAKHLVVRHVVELPDSVTQTIVIGEPTQFIRNDVWQLTQVMLFIGGGLLVVAPAGGYLLARRATRPVRQIIATTKSLVPTRLDSRLPIRGSGDELDQISAEINSFVDQIARFINSQREFVANAAHELRSPLTAIQTSAEVCLTKPRTAEQYREELETVSEQCQYLRYLVNQLLELAESDAGAKLEKAEFDFGELVQKSLAIFSGVAEEKGIRIIEQVPPQVAVVGDRNKLIQVLNNLFDNAIKFTPAHGTIDIELVVVEGQLRFRVANDGPGVPDHQLGRIFERFFQVDPARSRNTRSGNGLGLSICKSIIELHDGQIRATNNGRFAIEFELPAANVV